MKIFVFRPILRIAIFSLALAGLPVFLILTRAQQVNEFRTIFGGFAIKLPEKYSEYKPASFKIADYSFPARIYRWNFEHEIFSISTGEGTNDLEKPEYTKLFLDDLRKQYADARLKQNGTIIDEGAWSFEGHPGWQMVERHAGLVVNLRFFVIGTRFYTISVAVNDNLGVNEARQNTLDSFRLLTATEVAEEKERLIQTFAPPALPQQPAINRPMSDAQEDNLRGPVKSIYVEEEQYLGKAQPLTRFPRLREQFDQNGYLVSKIEYLDFLPYKAYSYGYADGARAYIVSERPSLEEQAAFALLKKVQPPPPQLFKVERRYDKAGWLAEVKASTDKPKIEQVYSYKEKNGTREITFSERDRFARDISTKWKSTVQLDSNGNPIAETRIDYAPFVITAGGQLISTEKQVNSHEVVGDAIRGETMISPNGTTRPPSVAEVNKNPNLTQRVIQSTNADAPKVGSESTYSYTYEFDSHGNWTRRVQNLVKKADKSTAAVTVPLTVTYRTITYY
jgi:hypothetical protein